MMEVENLTSQNKHQLPRHLSQPLYLNGLIDTVSKFETWCGKILEKLNQRKKLTIANLA